jgi:hypothetical protein
VNTISGLQRRKRALREHVDALSEEHEKETEVKVTANRFDHTIPAAEYLRGIFCFSSSLRLSYSNSISFGLGCGIIREGATDEAGAPQTRPSGKRYDALLSLPGLLALALTSTSALQRPRLLSR